jgi:DNA-directed RNA polymerase sigma subunit (sigma70/sigma32)
VRNDIKLSAKIVHNLDSRAGLWSEDKKEISKEEETKKEQTANDIEQAVNILNIFLNYVSKYNILLFIFHFRLLDYRQKIQF